MEGRGRHGGCPLDADNGCALGVVEWLCTGDWMVLVIEWLCAGDWHEIEEKK